MEISFYENHLITSLKVIGKTSQRYNVIIDTGSDRTSIPKDHCKDLGLLYSGDERSMTTKGDFYIHTFRARIEIDERRFNIDINGIDGNTCVLGLDILSKYKLTVDWISDPQTAKAEY